MNTTSTTYRPCWIDASDAIGDGAPYDTLSEANEVFFTRNTALSAPDKTRWIEKITIVIEHIPCTSTTPQN